MKTDKQILKILNEISYQLDFMIRKSCDTEHEVSEEEYDETLANANEHFEEMLK